MRRNRVAKVPSSDVSPLLVPRVDAGCVCVCGTAGSSSGRPRAAFTWLREVEDDAATCEKLEGSGGFDALYAKISSEVSDASESVDLQRSVNARN
eukprot:7607748-Pyramimonas_sp.AAC.2